MCIRKLVWLINNYLYEQMNIHIKTGIILHWSVCNIINILIYVHFLVQIINNKQKCTVCT